MILVYIELLAGVDLERFMVAGKLTQEKCKNLNTSQAFSQKGISQYTQRLKQANKPTNLVEIL